MSAFALGSNKSGPRNPCSNVKKRRLRPRKRVRKPRLQLLMKISSKVLREKVMALPSLLDQRMVLLEEATEQARDISQALD
jgi:hypothetical protein